MGTRATLCVCQVRVHVCVCVCRALARKGSVYLRQEQWQDAIKWFDKSLAEHWDQEVVKKKQKVSLHSGSCRVVVGRCVPVSSGGEGPCRN